MLDFKYENQGTNTYLAYKINENDTVDSMSLGMLTNNKIAGLAPAIFTQVDATKYIYYNVSSHISVKQFFSGPVNKKRLIGVFNGIVSAMFSAEDYMIDVNSIIMDLDYIFADVSTCETVLICLPISKVGAAPTDLATFFKNIMFSTQFDQTENCDHIAKIMNYLNSTPVFSIVDFKALLNSIDVSSNTQPVASKSQPMVSAVRAKPVQKPVQTVLQQPIKAEPAKSVQSAVKPASVPSQVQSVQEKSMLIPQAQVVSTPSSEKKISVFDLLMHYNKENAAKYKAQKEAKKQSKSGNKPQKQSKTPVEAKNKQQPSNNFGFAVPGQATPPATPSITKAQNISQSTPPQPMAVPASAKNIQMPPQPTYSPQQPIYTPPVAPKECAANFGETTVLGGNAIGETTVLTASNNPTQNVTPHLLRKKNNEKIALNKPVFRVGKERSYVDYFIGDNTAISRSHANFITRDSEYFVVDTNSTNHTFVNDTMLQSNIEMAISHGDVIRLANEEFEFKLY